jgi:hypothetical protein
VQSPPQRGGVAAAGRFTGRSDSVFRRVLESCLPGGQQRQVSRTAAAVRGRGQGRVRGGFGLGQDRVGRQYDLLGGIGRERIPGHVAGEHVQYRHVRQAASLAVTQLVCSGHDAPPGIAEKFISA